MKKFITLTFLSIQLLFVSGNAAFAQNQQPSINEHEQCGTQQWMETQFRTYSGLREQYERMERKMGDAVAKKLAKAKANASNPSALRSIIASETVITIPIVFHIVNSSPSTITDARIYALLDTLNKDFGGNNADSSKILPAFKPYFGKGKIRFCLAQRTPAGIATNGIMRYTSSVISTGSGSSSDPIKSSAAGGADAWDPYRYYNVWIGTFSTSGLLGYASFPINSAENPAGLLSQQGVVIEKESIPGGSTTDYNTGRVLTHETGHYFWLRHIWGDAACGDDFPNTPGIDDTPPAADPSWGCATGILATGCSGSYPNGRMYQNYMDYSNSTCMAMFSIGQTIRMGVALDSFRTSLKTSNGCEPLSCPAFNITVTSTGATSVAVNVSGGTAPYTYSLDSVSYQSDNQFSGLAPGFTYTMYVRDAVFCKGKVTFTANGVTVLPLAANTFCVNQTLAVRFTTNGIFTAGNIFTAQLSDTVGVFNSPVNIGTITSLVSGTINATIPAATAPGSKYRIRVIASNPSVIGNDNGSNIEINNISVPPSILIAVSAGNNPGCTGSSISFTATSVNGGTAPVYQWKRNGANISTGVTFSSSTLVNNDVISCSLTSNSTCAATTTATSNLITVRLSSNLLPSVSIAANASDTICSGTTVVFTATPANGGTSPVYQWRKNGVSTGITTATYSTSSLASGDTITCQLSSSLLCASPVTAISNKLKFVVIPSVVPSVSISSSVGISPCSGTMITFTATPANGGSSPSYQWKKNGINIGTNNPVYTTSNLVNGDSITCVMTRTSPAVCLSSSVVTSNFLKMSIQNCSTQLLNGNAFLKENYVEVAVGPCGNFASTVVAPTGFHPRGTGNSSVSGQLGFVADTSKNSWLNYVGDYFLPGSPEEGFGLSINGSNYNNNLICATNEIPGSIVNVESGDLEKSATWQGNIGGLNISSKTYIPSGALYFVTKVTVTNVSSAPVNNIYYMRNVDPDQGVNTPNSTLSSSTYNSIVYQMPNPCNRSLVSATTTLSGSDYLGIGSIDPRARVTRGGFTNRSAQNIWNGVGFSQSGTNIYGDSAISIAFKLGTLNINESTSFSFAHILSSTSLDQALAATGIGVNINGIKADIGKVNDVCSGAAVPINLNNTGTYTSWTWSPASGLDTTKGTSVKATVTTPISYTATGTGSCGTITVTISLNPVTVAAVGNAGTITGPANPAQGAGNISYSISPVANATRYIWKLPAGVLVNSGADSNIINVRIPAFAFCDSIAVTPMNACGAGSKSALAVCVTSPYSITPGTIAGVCAVSLSAFLPYTATTGSPTAYSIIWDSAALAVGFVNVTNAALPASPITITKPALLEIGNYNGKITVGNGTFSGAYNNFILPVVNTPVLVPSVTIAASTSLNICSGTPVIFTATPVNGGSIPIFQWRKNGINVGTASATYTDNDLLNGDSVTCILTSTASCVSPAVVTSPALKFIVNTTAVTSVSISTAFGKYACKNAAVAFTALGLNIGASPVFEWKKNGVVVATGITFTTSSLVNGDTISCSLTSNNPCLTTVTVNSNVIIMDIATVTTPTVSGPVTVNCGAPALLTATVTTAGNIINWYTSATGGTPFARGDSAIVTPSVTAVYYAEAGSASGGAGKSVTAIGTSGAVVIDHGSLTGDDHGGIAIGANYVYYSGDNYTGRFNKDLSGGTALPLRDGFFSNLTTGEIWQLGNSSSNGSSLSNGTITQLYQLNESLVPTGNYLTLSAPFTIGSYSFVAAGEGFVIIFTNSTFYRINLNTGELTNMNGATGFSFTISETWASYGWAEFDGSNYFVCYVANSTTISKRNVATGAVTDIQYFTSLSDMAAITFDTQAGRMYFHHEYSSQFGGSSETLGYVSVTVVENTPLCASARVPITVNVNVPSITPAVSIIANLTGTICAGSAIQFTANGVNGGTNPVYQWKRNGINIATGVTYSSNTLLNNDVISCEMTSSLFCVTTTLATSNSIILQVTTPATFPSISISASTSGTVCAGKSNLFTATALNAGASPSYQWKKNGINVGTNSASYTDYGLTNGLITCVMSTNIPCAITLTSNSISIISSAPVQPTVSISSNLGNNICSGVTVTFTATAINGGSTPLYQWMKNGLNVGTGSTYVASNLVNADTIACTMSSSITCVTEPVVTSNLIGITVSPVPSINTVTNKTVCPGSTVSPITFSGTGVQYRWTNSYPGIGLPASGIGNIPAFIAANADTSVLTATITATPLSGGIGYAYIANSNNNTVSVVNLSNNNIVAVIPVGSSPWAVAAAPNGNEVYVSNIGNPASVSVISTATNQVTSTIPLTGISYNICVSPDGLRLYTTNYSYGYISVYNTSNNTLLSTYYTGSNLQALAISPDGTRLYASAANNLYVLNSSGSLLATIPTGANSNGIAVSADGSNVYVSNPSNNTVAVVNSTTNIISTSIPVGNSPYGIILSPDGKKLYVANNGSNSVSVINTITSEVIATIPAGSDPSGISINMDGTLVYVINQTDNSVSVINAANNTVIRTITGFFGPVSWGNFMISKPGCTGTSISFTIKVGGSNFNTWTGTVSTDWHNPANWLCERVPTAADRILIAISPNNFYPVISNNDVISIKSIRLEPGTSVKMGTNAVINLSGIQ